MPSAPPATPGESISPSPVVNPATPGQPAASGGKAKPVATRSAPPAAATRDSISRPAAQSATAKPAEKQPAPATLDLASLTQRLKDTHAIGVFTKLSLKNQVDDLLDEFRAFYRGDLKTSLAELRQRYDLLLLKVLALLQDSDATLAASIASSREAIWDILSDPAKFAKI